MAGRLDRRARSLTDAIRKVHDFLTVGAPAPLQEGVAAALDELDPAFYDGLAASYRQRRDLLYGALVEAGFHCRAPEGAYYILADFTGVPRTPPPPASTTPRSPSGFPARSASRRCRDRASFGMGRRRRSCASFSARPRRFSSRPLADCGASAGECDLAPIAEVAPTLA